MAACPPLAGTSGCLPRFFYQNGNIACINAMHGACADAGTRHAMGFHVHAVCSGRLGFRGDGGRVPECKSVSTLLGRGACCELQSSACNPSGCSWQGEGRGGAQAGVRSAVGGGTGHLQQ